MALVTSHTEPVVLTNGLPSTPASPGSYFGFGLNSTKSASTGPRLYVGAGNPNGVLVAPLGSQWTDNVAGIVYINTNAASAWSVLGISAGTTNVIPDPGTGVAIPVTASGTIELTIGAGAETNTLAAPTFQGQVLVINADTVGAGTRAITCATTVNIAGNTVMTFNAVRDAVVLRAITVGGAPRWMIEANLSVTLS